VAVGGQHLPVGDGLRSAEFEHFARRKRLAALQQLHHGLGHFVHVNGLHRLLATPRNRNDRQACQRGKQRGTGTAWPVHQRRPQHGAFHGQAGEQVVGLQLAQQVGHAMGTGLVAHAQRRHLHHAVHARQRGPLE
jgi:hypothetical protein